MYKLQQLKNALITHYSVPLSVPFRQFRNGTIYFGVGLAMVLMANTYMSPSILQEGVVLAGLVLGGCGFILAMMAQVRLLISRIIQFYQRKD